MLDFDLWTEIMKSKVVYEKIFNCIILRAQIQDKYLKVQMFRTANKIEKESPFIMPPVSYAPVLFAPDLH